MKNLMSRFGEFALNRSEMKSITGGGCGSSCYWPDGSSDQMAGYGTVSKKEALIEAAGCIEDGGRAYWCCASC